MFNLRILLILVSISTLLAQKGNQQFLFSNSAVSGGSSPITLGTHTLATGNGSTVTTSTIDTSGCSIIILAVSSNDLGIGTTTPTDSKSNTWTALTDYETGTVTFTQVQLFYATNPTVGSGHTFTYNLLSSAPTLAAACFNNVKTTSPFDAENGGSTNPTGTSVATGSITPSLNNELIVTMTSIYKAGNDPSGYTMIDSQVYTGSSFLGLAWAYKVQTTAGAENVTWQNSDNSYLATTIASFKNQ